MCAVDRGRTGGGAVRSGFPKLKFIGAEKPDGFGETACFGGGRTGGGFGTGDGLTTGGGRGMGTRSSVDGATSTGGAGGDGAGASTGGTGGDGAGGSTGGAGGDGAGGGGSTGTGGTGGIGSGTASAGGVAGTDGLACNEGFGRVGPLFRPLSNSIVTAEGGGNCSGLSSRRILTSNRTPIATCSSSEIRTARRIRHGWPRGGRRKNAFPRRDPLNSMPRVLSAPQQEHALLPEQVGHPGGPPPWCAPAAIIGSEPSFHDVTLVVA